MIRHLLPEMVNGGVVWLSLPMKLLTVVHSVSFVDSSTVVSSAGGGWVSMVAGGCVLGVVNGLVGVIELQAIKELTAMTVSPMYKNMRTILMLGSYDIFFFRITIAAVIPAITIIIPVINK